MPATVLLHLLLQKLQEVLDTKFVAYQDLNVNYESMSQSEKQDWSFVNWRPNLTAQSEKSFPAPTLRR